MDEHVLVIPTVDVVSLLDGAQGFVVVPFDRVIELIKTKGHFIPRNLAEQDESLRQIIPYMIAIKGDGLVLLMRRTKRQGEKRLHDKYSLGIGGHINDSDSNDPVEAFFNGKHREFEEEVDADVLDERYLGIINDTSTEVGRVHLGIAYLLKLDFRKIREEDQMESWWVRAEDLSNYENALEGWSRVVLPVVESFLGHSRSGQS